MFVYDIKSHMGTDFHTFVSYFRVFHMSTILPCVWPTALNLGSIVNFDMLMGFIKFNLC